MWLNEVYVLFSLHCGVSCCHVHHNFCFECEYLLASLLQFCLSHLPYCKPASPVCVIGRQCICLLLVYGHNCTAHQSRVSTSSFKHEERERVKLARGSGSHAVWSCFICGVTMLLDQESIADSHCVCRSEWDGTWTEPASHGTLERDVRVCELSVHAVMEDKVHLNLRNQN